MQYRPAVLAAFLGGMLATLPQPPASAQTAAIASSANTTSTRMRRVVPIVMFLPPWANQTPKPDMPLWEQIDEAAPHGGALLR